MTEAELNEPFQYTLSIDEDDAREADKQIEDKEEDIEEEE